MEEKIKCFKDLRIWQKGIETVSNEEAKLVEKLDHICRMTSSLIKKL